MIVPDIHCAGSRSKRTKTYLWGRKLIPTAREFVHSLFTSWVRFLMPATLYQKQIWFSISQSRTVALLASGCLFSLSESHVHQGSLVCFFERVAYWNPRRKGTMSKLLIFWWLSLEMKLCVSMSYKFSDEMPAWNLVPLHSFNITTLLLQVVSLLLLSLLSGLNPKFLPICASPRASRHPFGRHASSLGVEVGDEILRFLKCSVSKPPILRNAFTLALAGTLMRLCTIRFKMKNPNTNECKMHDDVWSMSVSVWIMLSFHFKFEGCSSVGIACKFQVHRAAYTEINPYFHRSNSKVKSMYRNFAKFHRNTSNIALNLDTRFKIHKPGRFGRFQSFP